MKTEVAGKYRRRVNPMGWVWGKEPVAVLCAFETTRTFYTGSPVTSEVQIRYKNLTKGR